MTCAPAISATPQHLLASAIRAIAKTYRTISGASSGRAARTGKKAKKDALLLLVKREILINERAIAKRRHSRVSHYDAQLKEITQQLLEG